MEAEWEKGAPFTLLCLLPPGLELPNQVGAAGEERKHTCPWAARVYMSVHERKREVCS